MGLNLTKLVWFLKIKYNVIFTNVIFHINTKIYKYIRQKYFLSYDILYIDGVGDRKQTQKER